MEHNDLRHKLSEYIDGSVTAREKTEMDEHLRTCTACSDAVREFRKTIEHIRTVEEIEPPAWMTQKIMAKVRAETGEKKGFFHRFFFPLRVKLPIQAVAVLFLAITAYTINQNIQRTREVSETQPQGFTARQEAPPTGTEKDKLDKADAPASGSMQVPQSPEYKALDMKLEYEKPAPPVLKERAATTPAPASAKPAEQPARITQDAAIEKRFAAPESGAPAVAPSAGKTPQAGATQGSAASQRKLKAAMADDRSGSTIAYTITVKDLEIAAGETESAIKRLDGTIVNKELLGARKIYSITLNVQRVSDLSNELRSIGIVTEKAPLGELREGQVTFSMELVEISTLP